ncbi:hypothetical protein AZE42_14033 [Rhizopogon vesiculosus]|uniref:Uncharacterized protein n=1 Tax=Rhizopogon vesiculosus TaxID=180088 RepID=A0A1J8PXC5_9AGAM|nr:hypothetical protein AZE42_14033 [Rhizopogon vesiculosus]
MGQYSRRHRANSHRICI